MAASDDRFYKNKASSLEDVNAKMLAKTAKKLANEVHGAVPPESSGGNFTVRTGSAGAAFMYLKLFEHYERAVCAECGEDPLIGDIYKCEKCGDTVCHPCEMDGAHRHSDFDVIPPSSLPYLSKAVAYINAAIDEVEDHLDDEDFQPEHSFISGPPGVYALAAVIFRNAYDIDESIAAAGTLFRYFDEENVPGAEYNDLARGTAGYLAALDFVEAHIPDAVPADLRKNVLAKLLFEGKRFAHGRYGLLWPHEKKLMFGVGYGTGGVLYMLLHHMDELDSEEKRRVRATIDSMLECQWSSGNFPLGVPFDRETRKPLVRQHDKQFDLRVQWCHGGAGMIFLLLKAYAVFGSDKYLDAAEKAGGDVWKRGLVKKGPGLCHGLAGSAYAMMALYQATEDEEYLKKAQSIVSFSGSPEFSGDCDNPHSLYEGKAGLAVAMLDLADKPEEAYFPGFEPPMFGSNRYERSSSSLDSEYSSQYSSYYGSGYSDYTISGYSSVSYSGTGSSSS